MFLILKMIAIEVNYYTVNLVIFIECCCRCSLEDFILLTKSNNLMLSNQIITERYEAK